MPTRTLKTTAVLAHVPVDRFEIVNGPGASKCMEIQERLRSTGGEVEHDFTLLTPASAHEFRRALRIASIFSVQDGRFNFTALFSGKIVSGVYDMKNRTGWFNLD